MQKINLNSTHFFKFYQRQAQSYYNQLLMQINSRSQDKTKRLFKFAYINQPQSIRSLKRSLTISNSNIETFAKNIGDFTNVRLVKEKGYKHRTQNSQIISELQQDKYVEDRKNQSRLHASRKQITQQLTINKIRAQTSHLRPKNKLISKSFKLQSPNNKNQMVTGQNTKKKMQPLHCSQYQFVLPKSVQHSVNSTKRQYWHINEPRNRNIKTATHKNKNESMIQTQRNPLNTHRNLSFQREKANQTGFMRHRTESNQRGTEKSLGYLTNYDNSKNNKALNCLVLQLQLNLQIEKKVKNKTLN